VPVISDKQAYAHTWGPFTATKSTMGTQPVDWKQIHQERTDLHKQKNVEAHVDRILADISRSVANMKKCNYLSCQPSDQGRYANGVKETVAKAHEQLDFPIHVDAFNQQITQTLKRCSLENGLSAKQLAILTKLQKSTYYRNIHISLSEGTNTIDDVKIDCCIYSVVTGLPAKISFQLNYDPVRVEENGEAIHSFEWLRSSGETKVLTSTKDIYELTSSLLGGPTKEDEEQEQHDGPSLEIMCRFLTAALVPNGLLCRHVCTVWGTLTDSHKDPKVQADVSE